MNISNCSKRLFVSIAAAFFAAGCGGGSGGSNGGGGGGGAGGLTGYFLMYNNSISYFPFYAKESEIQFPLNEKYSSYYGDISGTNIYIYINNGLSGHKDPLHIQTYKYNGKNFESIINIKLDFDWQRTHNIRGTTSQANSGLAPSPNINHLAFVSYEDGNRSDSLYIIDKRGKIEFILDEGYRFPTWLSDNELIVSSKGGNILIADITQKKIRELRVLDDRSDNYPLSLSLSPDKKRLAYVYDSKIWTVNTDNGKIVNQITDGNSGEGGPTHISWSPDGQQLGYVPACDTENVKIGSYSSVIYLISSTKSNQNVDVDGKRVGGPIMECGEVFQLVSLGQ